jgi:nitroreductase
MNTLPLNKNRSKDMRKRETKYNVVPMVLNRWSPRAMSGEKITQEELETLFDAAQWAQSSYNNQPWRFVYATRDTSYWQTFFNLLIPFNQEWCKNAAALVMVISKNNFAFNNQFSRTHSFDTGAACQNFALQGFSMKLVVHGMEGFDYDKAKKDLNIPDEYTVEAMFAIGRPGNIQNLSLELQKKEILSDRKDINEFAFEGRFLENKK